MNYFQSKKQQKNPESSVEQQAKDATKAKRVMYFMGRMKENVAQKVLKDSTIKTKDATLGKSNEKKTEVETQDKTKEHFVISYDDSDSDDDGN